MIDKGQWREFRQDTRVTPLLFTRCAMGFLMTKENQDLGLTSHPNAHLNQAINYSSHNPQNQVGLILKNVWRATVTTKHIGIFYVFCFQSFP